MKRLAILGASGHGKVVADAAERCGWDVRFFDDNKSLGPKLLNWPIVGGFQDLLTSLDEFDGIIVGIGNNAVRLEKSRTIMKKGGALVSIVHPASTISTHTTIGQGTVVAAGAIINADTHLGLACIVNTAATIDHDCAIGDGVHVSPGAHLAGEVSVGTCSWVGIGASVRQQTKIGKFSMIAAGAAVVNDVDSDTVVAGVPAAKLR